MFLFLSESYAKLLISTKTLEKEKEEAMKQLVRLVTLAVVSVIIILDCPTLESLDRLWSDYISGHLDKNAKRHLVIFTVLAVFSYIIPEAASAVP